MSSLPNLVLTNAGATLLAKSPIGSPVPVTKWQIGTGVLPDGTNLRTRTKLVSVYTDVDIARVENDGNECLVTGNFVNKGYGAFTWSETGLFAQDPDVGEILYAYGNVGSDGGVPIPAGTTQYREVEFGVQLVFDVAANVTSTVSQSMIYATRNDLKTKADLQDGKVPYAQTPHLTGYYLKYYYVDAAQGDDANPGTQEQPFKTIQAAVDSLPKDLGKCQVTIFVASGTYDEDVAISGFYGGLFSGPLKIKGSDAADKTRKIRTVSVANCSCMVTLEGLCVSGNLSGFSVAVCSANVFMTRCIVEKGSSDATAGIAAGEWGAAQVTLSGVTVDGYNGSSGAGVRVGFASMVSIIGGTIKNCTTGLQCGNGNNAMQGIAMYRNVTFTGCTTETAKFGSSQIFGG